MATESKKDGEYLSPVEKKLSRRVHRLMDKQRKRHRKVLKTLTEFQELNPGVSEYADEMAVYIKADGLTLAEAYEKATGIKAIEA